MLDFKKILEQKFKNSSKSFKAKVKIVFPESKDLRILEAVKILSSSNVILPILLSTEEIDIKSVQVINPVKYLNLADLENLYFKLRKHKKITKKDAIKETQNYLNFSALLLKIGSADGCIAGAVNPTGNVLKSAISIVGLANKDGIVNSSFILITSDNKVLSFGDCAVLPNPDKVQLAKIAIDTANTFNLLTQQVPKVAMLSFSTKGSAQTIETLKVVEATEIVKTINPSLIIDGDLQFDTAFVKGVATKKAPNSVIKGDANVFIFPSLDAGNIGYKIAERLGNATAIGPIIQGLSKPFNDLSRGCSVDDIVNLTYITALQSLEK